MSRPEGPPVLLIGSLLENATIFSFPQIAKRAYDLKESQ